MRKGIKLFDPITDMHEKNIIQKVLSSHFWASGKGIGKVLEFENKFKKFTNSKECFGVNNGTSALHLALSLFDIKNKEVILPSLSFVSTAHAIIYNGGKPVFADVDSKTLCLDPNDIIKKISKNTKVVLPVHFAGLSSDLKLIKKICKENDLVLVEDAAHAAGTYFNKKRIGSHGNAVCFSFHPVKNLAMPTGGAITLNDSNSKKFSEIIKERRWCGISDRKNSNYDIKKLGWNYYMNEFSAAIGIEQLKKLDKMNKIRRKIAKRYFSELNLEDKMPFDKDCSYHFYWIQVKNRTKFMQNMKKNGIETGIHYHPIHKMTFYKTKSKLSNTEKAGKKIVSLPTHPNLDNEDVDRVIRFSNKFLE